MKRLIALTLFVPTVAFGQINLYEELESGTPKAWPATTIALTFDVAEPVGPIELNFRIEIEPITVNPYNGDDFLRLAGGSIVYRDLGRVDLPGQLLACLPLPRPREANLVVLYIDPSDSATGSEEVMSYVTIPYGRPSAISVAGAEFMEYPSVEIGVTGDEVRRAAFIKANGERNVLRSFSESCPREFVDWASPPRATSESLPQISN